MSSLGSSVLPDIVWFVVRRRFALTILLIKVCCLERVATIFLAPYCLFDSPVEFGVCVPVFFVVCALCSPIGLRSLLRQVIWGLIPEGFEPAWCGPSCRDLWCCHRLNIFVVEFIDLLCGVCDSYPLGEGR